jgi:hypothetical protein
MSKGFGKDLRKRQPFLRHERRVIICDFYANPFLAMPNSCMLSYRHPVARKNPPLAQINNLGMGVTEDNHTDKGKTRVDRRVKSQVITQMPASLWLLLLLYHVIRVQPVAYGDLVHSSVFLPLGSFPFPLRPQSSSPSPPRSVSQASLW